MVKKKKWFPRWSFRIRISDPGGGSTFGASESGTVPDSIAGTSDFSPGREVRTGHLAHRNVSKVTEATSNCMTKKIIFLLFLCDAPLWVCLLYVYVWYRRVPGASNPELKFILCYVTLSAV